MRIKILAVALASAGLFAATRAPLCAGGAVCHAGAGQALASAAP